MFPTPILGKGSIGFPVQYWENVLGFTNQYRDRFYRFPRPVLGKGSIGSPFQYWENFLVPQTSTEESFYRFPSPVLGKVLGSPVHYLEIILDFPVHAVLGTGSISSQVQYWEKVL